MQAADAIDAVTDASGATIVLGFRDHVAGYLAKVAPDGALVFEHKSPLEPASQGRVALGESGSFWIGAGGTLWKYDSSGNLISTREVPDHPVSRAAIRALASDGAGNVYAAIEEYYPSALRIIAVTPAGNVTASHRLTTAATPFSIAVDATGAVYIAGQTSDSAFPTTAGAFLDSNPTVSSTRRDGFVLKLAAGLKTVEYATFLGGAEDDLARAIAVDSSGNAVIGGSAVIGTPQPTFRADYLGIDFGRGDRRIGFVVKLNAAGSGLVYSTGLCFGEVASLVLAPDGGILALAYLYERQMFLSPAVFHLNAAGNRIDGARYLNQTPTQGRANIVVREDGRIRVVLNAKVARFPVVETVYYGFLSFRPLLLDLDASLPAADLSVDLSAQPVVPGVEAVMRATITNRGLSDAESVWLYRMIPLNGAPTQLPGCASSAPVVCSENGVQISRIPAGGSVWVELRTRPSSTQLSPELEETVAVLALSGESDFQNNFARTSIPVVTGQRVPFSGSPLDFILYRSDYSGRVTYLDNLLRNVNAFPVTVTVPTPQRANGNLWHFAAWADGSTENPRIFTELPGDSAIVAEFRAASPVGLDPDGFDFTAWAGVTPPQQTLTLYPGIISPGVWSITPPTAPWLKLGPVRPGRFADVTLTAEAQIAGLTPGEYSASVMATYKASNGSTHSVNVPVTLHILEKEPAVSPNGIVNAASFRPAPLAQMEVVAIFGTGLGPKDALVVNASEGEMPTVLGGTRVLFNDVPARLISVQENQITAIVPTAGLLPGAQDDSWKVTVERGGVVVASEAVARGQVSPALFTADGSGSGRATAVNRDGTRNATNRPARRGTEVVFYGVGFAGSGMLSSLSEGCRYDQYGSTSPAVVRSAVDAFVGGKQADVVYAGSAVGRPCAIQEIHVVIPEDSDTGPAIPVVLRVLHEGAGISFRSTQPGVTIAIE